MLRRIAAVAACVLALALTVSRTPVPGPSNASVVASNRVPQSHREELFSLKAKYERTDDIKTAETVPADKNKIEIASIDPDSVSGNFLDRAGETAKTVVNAVQEFATSMAKPEPLMDPGLDMRPAPKIRQQLSREETCNAIELASLEHKIPVNFFGRLIWQESKHNPEIVSKAGAQGIAQFMPGTAAEWGLQDPFDPVASLLKSAKFLRALNDKFGNIGLAAAAYNGGPGRLERWLDTWAKNKKATLPMETQNYVRIITGKPVTEWVGVTGEKSAEVIAKNLVPCVTQTVEVAKAPAKTEKVAEKSEKTTEKSVKTEKTEKPVQVADTEWNVQLIGAWTEQKAQEQFAMLKKKYPAILGARRPSVFRAKLAKGGQATFIRVAAATQNEGNELCAKLKETGGSCAVLKNAIKTASKS